MATYQDFEKLGIWMDHEHAYKPIEKSFISGQWAFFKKAWDQGRLYKGKKVIITDIYNYRFKTTRNHQINQTIPTYQQMRSQSLQHDTQFILFIFDPNETELIKQLHNSQHPFYNWLVKLDLE